MPDPAAMRLWCVPGSKSGVKEPAGGATSTSSPGRTLSTNHSENSPVSTRRTPTLGKAPAGAARQPPRRQSSCGVGAVARGVTPIGPLHRGPTLPEVGGRSPQVWTVANLAGADAQALHHDWIGP